MTQMADSDNYQPQWRVASLISPQAQFAVTSQWQGEKVESQCLFVRVWWKHETTTDNATLYEINVKLGQYITK